MPAPQPTADRLRELFGYDPDTGVMRWRVSTNSRVVVGQEAGCVNGGGYIVVSVDGRLYRAHRLIWLYVYGRWPGTDIDHIDGDPQNNRLTNLREATVSQNQANARRRANNTSGFKGVNFHKRGRKWQARIRVNGKSLYLGFFDSREAAHAAYVAAARELFGEFARAA